MDYDFFLFCKLLDCFVITSLEYDLQWEHILTHYRKFCLQDTDDRIGTYEAIERYIKANVNEIASDLKGNVIHN